METLSLRKHYPHSILRPLAKSTGFLFPFYTPASPTEARPHIHSCTGHKDPLPPRYSVDFKLLSTCYLPHPTPSYFSVLQTIHTANPRQFGSRH